MDTLEVLDDLKRDLVKYLKLKDSHTASVLLKQVDKEINKIIQSHIL